ncbi:MAG TPA: UDP-N-acetylmuramoyl-tripeptide--D-alanyl-D-alanine ligase [Clostridia bacterium]|jgi:UDP-N-acetylmuramoyl-tripeptide--D-alanyl-D-alanine ligase|nr:UDP-N-acetylmuramoyl-tripeptide--D-alanyl-D-alanine ligase [Clostridiaceae bacterium]HOF26964.1 UDP-N-acetylmuramoyl-tripeptide--D-alanyl-D-alanine ligase [Clostridia bacterium]HOR90347.1 UDP-N-acetylmuramoyl-tripeptide--D-alanyl-D-alanine ligase [Clostridia bacterium]HOT70158.1 UDP-N-acetylmuramoyl-tripeptide--D-alanyl-D-alanine ligase [Clostridia bacterium]HPL08542.1 UDP-N-acetylmuramoyl-tripeptide--D-alanyl-D-alanine ligase [Clostridia bacterium]
MRIELGRIYDLFATGLKTDKKTVVTGVSIDSRTIQPGEIFFAIKGENFDGHNFVNKALEKKAAAAVCSRKDKYAGDNIIYVEDTVTALQDLARFYRRSLDIPFIAVTGSNGKTTTKDYTGAALAASFKTDYTKGNLNNQTGVPLTVFSVGEDSKAAVIEMGMNNAGEIRQLSSVVLPDIAVITNIGTSHIGNLGSRENIFKAKTEVLEYMDNGYLIVNADDDMLRRVKNNHKYKVIRVGILADDLDYRARNIVKNADNTYTFSVTDTKIKLSIPGIHNIVNALLAFAVADILKADRKKAAQAIGACTNQVMRTQISEIDGYTVINDAYNANYDSMRMAIDILKNYRGRKVAVLGDMLELGDFEEMMHERTGEYLAYNKIDVLIAVGKNADCYKKGATDFGMEEKSIHVFPDIPQAKKHIMDIICKGDTILVKGSRGSSMEKILEVFEGDFV